MAGFSIDRNKGKISDIKQNIENNKSELHNLENNKQELLDLGTAVQVSDLDEDHQQVLMEKINEDLEENAEKGKEIAETMTSDFQNVEGIRQETQESLNSNAQVKSKFEHKKAMLDKFGLGRGMEEGIAELDDNRMELEGLMDDLSNTEKELTEVSRKLQSL